MLAISTSSYNKQFLIFHPPVKNIMMDQSHFIRIYYSTHNVIFNGIYLILPTLDDSYRIERDILDSYKTDKKPIYSIKKLYKQKHLKISGLWENEHCYGIVFKFIS